MAPPPLIGDSNGQYRVHIVGNSGALSSTTGKRLAVLLGVPFIALDTLFWKPGWQESTTDEMRAKLARALADAPHGWVVDGNYPRRVGSLVDAASTDIIWLDPPLALYLPRLVLRTVRLFGLGEPCSPGCNESLSSVFFSRESIVWWCITNHRPCRARQRARMAQIGVGVGSDVAARKMRRIGGWGGELRAWLDDVNRMLHRRYADMWSIIF
ncbi:hypothetical protein GGX14DRAFT_380568 [Mycena pura]|uniref:Adenylate kinase n=1 Tax=Mycena pura TaxID=153505 RepID=A0AAD6UPT6_9AGAR|nr:hypothetical protein GGX14DRAFT_380568 [Mycena pura]